MKTAKFNVQQTPKDEGYLACLQARPGHQWVQLDFSSVEPTILAEFSKCPNYRKLYGPEANPNQDTYLFLGSKFNHFRDEVLKYYDPENPTAESTTNAIKILKASGLRGIFKESHLAMQYGASAGTVHAALTRKEIDIDFEEVVQMHQDYWSPALFSVVKEYEGKLRREWYRNRGWIKNCLGRPQSIDETCLKDLLNRACQSSGHDLLMKLIRHIDVGRTAKRLPMWPVIVDLHDETIWEVEKAAAEEAAQLFRDSLAKLNDALGWEIKLKGEPQLAHNLAQIKCGE